MFALADCNNFYASCERVFKPSVIGKAIVVLSNNDGCVIARSEEAKAMGIRMGVPAFEIEGLRRSNQIEVFSSNYPLYGDMSRRVMATLSTFVPEIEIYSIDECFLDFRSFEEHYDIREYALGICKTVLKNIGLPVSIGIAPTKTLAKLANRLTKAKPEYKGVYIMQEDVEIQIALERYPIGEVWGIGRRYNKMLRENGIYTALDFTYALPNWVKSKMGVIGLRIWHELRGKPCIELEELPLSKQHICISRSFGTMLENYPDIEEAVSTHAARCAAKLRKQKTSAGVITVFVYTNLFRKDLPQYSKSITISLPVSTNSSFELIKYACMALKKAFKRGYKYKKTGVIVSEIRPEMQVTPYLFDTVDRAKHSIAMQAMDKLNNKYGKEKVQVSHQGFGRKWRLINEHLSKCYTTNINDIIEVY